MDSKKLLILSVSIMSMCVGFFSITSVSSASESTPSVPVEIAKSVNSQVTQEVKNAVISGPEALKSLIERLVSSRPTLLSEILGQATKQRTTPYEYALGEALMPYVTRKNQYGTLSSPLNLGDGPPVNVSSEQEPSERSETILEKLLKPNPLVRSNLSSPEVTTAANSAGTCYHVGGGIWDGEYFQEAGITVAWIKKFHAYWCGNGKSITENGLAGFGHGTFSQFPFCLGNVSNAYGWDAPEKSWAHGGIWASAGVITPWGACATYSSGKAVLRIDAKGQFDDYDDYVGR